MRYAGLSKTDLAKLTSSEDCCLGDGDVLGLKLTVPPSCGTQSWSLRQYTCSKLEVEAHSVLEIEHRTRLRWRQDLPSPQTQVR